MTADPAVEDATPAVSKFEWTNVVMRSEMPSSAKYLALILAAFANLDGTRVYPGVATLAAIMNRDERTVNRGRVWLRENGYITRVRQGNRYATRPDKRTDEYWLTLPDDVLDRLYLDPNYRRSR
jgi:hypothetical protein